MRNKIYILFILSFGLFLNSCDKTESEVGNPSGQTLVSFNSTTYDLPIVLDGEGSTSVELNITETASVDRTFNIEIVDSLTTADPSTYDLANSITIPANSYVGYLEINGFDNGVTTDPENLAIRLVDIEQGIVFDEENITTNISVYEICPVPSDFLVGEYRIEDVSATVGPDNGSANFATENVTISEGSSSTQRVFQATVLPGIAGQETVTINLSCNSFVLQTVDPAVTCDGEASYIYTAAQNNSTYDLENIQDEYVITYTEDIEGSCGGPFQSSFRLSKVE